MAKWIFFILMLSTQFSIWAAEQTETVKINIENNFHDCSKHLQNCQVTVSRNSTQCLNSPGSITLTNKSSIGAKNLSVSSTDSNFNNYIIQNNQCPSTLPPKQSCTIYFYTKNSISFTLTNVLAKGSNTNASYFDMRAVVCPFSYSIGGTVAGLNGTVILQNNGSSPTPIGSNGAFTFPMPVNEGSSYEITVLSQPSGQICTVTNGSGTNIQSNISNISIQCLSGALTPVPGSPFAAGSSLEQLAISPNGQFIYAANQVPNTVRGFNINNTGALTPIIGSPFSDGSGNPYGVTVHPNNSFLYITNFFNTVVGYDISNTGVLTSFSTNPVVSITAPQVIAITPNGQFAYLIQNGGNKVYGYNIGSTGAFTPISGTPVAAGNTTYFLAISPNGQFLYISNYNGNSISGYLIESTGTLTALPGSPYATGANPAKIAISPNSQFLYVTNNSGTSISGYSISTTGALAQVPGSPFPSTDLQPLGIAITPNGQLLYVTNSDSSSVSGYVISSTGALIEVAESPFASEGISLDIAISPNGQFVYVANQSADSITAYSITY